MRFLSFVSCLKIHKAAQYSSGPQGAWGLGENQIINARAMKVQERHQEITARGRPDQSEHQSWKAPIISGNWADISRTRQSW